MEIIECLLAGGADVNQKGYGGYTAYRSAAERGHRELVELFISKGVDISNIHGAACIGDLAKVKNYLDQGVDVNTKDELGWTPLIWAVSMSQVEVVENLLARGAEVNMQTADGIVPICNAAKKKSKRVIELLITHGANVNVRDGKGSTPLYWAAMYGNPAGIELLLDKGAEVNVHSKTSTFTPLHRASQWGHPAIVKMLIAHGADVNCKTKGGLTPLLMVPMQARIRALPGHNEVVEVLLKNGADTNAKDNRGRTPLDLARQFGQSEIVEIISKASKEQPAGNQESLGDEASSEPVNPLHQAAAGGDSKRVKELLDKGLDIDAKDNRGNAPLHIAALEGHLKIVELLIARGADVNARMKYG
jgi:cytohesin